MACSTSGVQTETSIVLHQTIFYNKEAIIEGDFLLGGQPEVRQRWKNQKHVCTREEEWLGLRIGRHESSAYSVIDFICDSW